MCKEKSIFWQSSGASVKAKQLQREICIRVWASGGRRCCSPLLNMVFWGQQEKFGQRDLKRFHLFREIAVSLKTKKCWAINKRNHILYAN